MAHLRQVALWRALRRGAFDPAKAKEAHCQQIQVRKQCSKGSGADLAAQVCWRG